MASSLSDSVAGKSGEDSIVDEFRRVYSELYNMGDDSLVLTELKNQLEEDTKLEDSAWQINKITGSVVKEASSRLKAKKGVVTKSYNNDMIRSCPDFFPILAAVYR